MKELKLKIRKMLLEPQPQDEFREGWCYALDWVLLHIEENEKKRKYWK
jgi:hypothetical protein